MWCSVSDEKLWYSLYLFILGKRDVTQLIQIISQCNNYVEVPDDEPENFNYIGDDDNSNRSNDLNLENNVNFSNIESLQLNHEGTNWKID